MIHGPHGAISIASHSLILIVSEICLSVITLLGDKHLHFNFHRQDCFTRVLIQKSKKIPSSTFFLISSLLFVSFSIAGHQVNHCSSQLFVITPCRTSPSSASKLIQICTKPSSSTSKTRILPFVKT